MSNSLELVKTNESVVEILELDAREDSFGNAVRLLWDPQTNGVRLSVGGREIPVKSEEAKDAMEHPYSLLYAAYGDAAVNQLTTVVPVEESVAA